MNIIVKTSSGHVIVRPDTTWEKDNEDFYPPEFVEELTFSPVFFARILKPGRSVGRKFARRYYDAVGFGALLYPENLVGDSQEGFAHASCLDHTSFLPAPLFPTSAVPQTGESESQPAERLKENLFRIFKDGGEIFSSAAASLNMIEDALAEATRFCYIRTGDIVAVELDARRPLVSRPADGTSATVRITGSFGQDTPLDFRIIF